MEYRIRKAGIEDVDTIFEMRKEISILESQLEPYYKTSEQVDKQRVINKIIDNEREYYLAVVENEVVGMLVVEEAETFNIQGVVKHKYLYIMDIVSKYKRKGIGKLLLNYANEIVKERNLDYYELDVLAKNQPALNFYKENGLREVSMVMRSK